MKKTYMKMTLKVKTQVDFSHEYLIPIDDWNSYTPAVREHIARQQQTIGVDAYAKMLRTEVEPELEIVEEDVDEGTTETNL
jgi:hypothetical protein